MRQILSTLGRISGKHPALRIYTVHHLPDVKNMITLEFQNYIEKHCQNKLATWSKTDLSSRDRREPGLVQCG